MSQSEVVTAQTVDLTNCDKEAIHIPGSIQPHGLLFVLEEPHLKVLQVSNNTYALIGIHSQNLLGKRLEDILDLQQIQSIRKCLDSDFESINPLKLSITNQDQTLNFDGIIHRSDDALILELEPSTSKKILISLNSII
jgi:light-regulated signal transduction histidine kinase (bacteriophytochrome)